MTLALADAATGRLLHALSLNGPTTARQLASGLALPLAETRELLRDAVTLGVVQVDRDDLFRIQPDVVTALVNRNRACLLGAAARA